MSRKPFRFKQFAMTDAHCGMRIGTDGVLLGAWASLRPEELRSVLDVGCGCGVIALMLAQRARLARVTALDCDAGAVTDAAANFASSPWADRIELADKLFEHFETRDSFDLIVSNPPFFTEDLRSPDAVRATARHEGSLSFDVLASRARPLLAPGGRMAVILPSDSDERTIASATLRGIYPRRHCRVSTRRDLPPVRSLWEFGTDDGACESTALVLRDTQNEFSTEYKLLTQEFHIFL